MLYLIDKIIKDHIIYYILASLWQGEKMSNIDQFELIDSVLTVKASGSINTDIINDLELPIGKSIAQLLNDQEKNQNPETD